MFRKSLFAAAILLASAPTWVFALGLGEINMQSALNQPMDAVIDLTSASSTDLSDISVTLAPTEAHARAGLSRAAILTNFRFSVEKDASGNAVVRITSTELVREPYLEFMLELDWSRGRLLRQYTVLVDPPVTMPAPPPVTVTPISRPATPAPVARAQTRKPVSRPVAAPTTVSVAPRASADSYGPIRRSETLWQIASRVRPGSDISIQQMMLALQRANPNAFVNNNINRLKAGVTLNVPGRDEVNSMSARDARAEARRQYNQWKEGDDQAVAVTEPAAEQPADESALVTESVSAPATESRLQLMAPENDAVSGAALPGDPVSGNEDATTPGMDQQLALATEEAAAGRAQSEELNARVSELEQQLTTMKRLLELKDDELAGLQQSIATDDLAVDDAANAAPENTDEVVAEAAVEADADAESDAVPVETPGEGLSERAAGLMNLLMDNPLLAGLGVLIAMLLGGFLWASNRQKNDQGIFDDELTMERQLADAKEREDKKVTPVVTVRENIAPVENLNTDDDDDADSDPVTEADVYLAYGRIQQAEDVLLAALQTAPGNLGAREKLLEVYHAGGNAAAFDQSATEFREYVSEDDVRWQKIVALGLTLSPQNALYTGEVKAEEADFDMDLSGLDEMATESDAPAGDAGLAIEGSEKDSNMIEFTLGTSEDDEDASEGLLEAADEVTTKLDLARAYIDMDDVDSARSILGEVMEEGSFEQKEEAETIIARLA